MGGQPWHTGAPGSPHLSVSLNSSAQAGSLQRWLLSAVTAEEPLPGDRLRFHARRPGPPVWHLGVCGVKCPRLGKAPQQTRCCLWSGWARPL